MLLNELPDDCLLVIFDWINELKDLINCYKVCEKWSNLIAKRSVKVKYLIAKHRSGEKNYSSDCVYYPTDEPIDGSYMLKLLPNLKIADVSPPYNQKERYNEISYPLLQILSNAKHLKGLIDDPVIDYMVKLECCPNLEMICFDFVVHKRKKFISGDLPIGSVETKAVKSSVINENVKQIYIGDYNRMILFTWMPIYFPNLERLCAYINDHGDARYVGPVFKNLKILELNLAPYSCSCLRYGFQLIDSCPALESVYIFADTKSLIIDDLRKHENLQDLVLEFFIKIEWKTLQRLLSKFPNLKHLALRDNETVKDENISQLISILPKLRLLDLRGSYEVTSKAADYVQDYCKQHGRSVKFYFEEDDKQIETDWPQLSTRNERICRGFDFMKHYFLKNIFDLPHFLDPMDS